MRKMSDAPPKNVTRRDAIKGAAAGAVVVWIGSPPAARRDGGSSTTDSGPQPDGAPDAALTPKNILVIMTDQERFHMNWPAGWEDQNLPSLARLKKNGLTFTNASTAACECS